MDGLPESNFLSGDLTADTPYITGDGRNDISSHGNPLNRSEMNLSCIVGRFDIEFYSHSIATL